MYPEYGSIGGGEATFGATATLNVNPFGKCFANEEICVFNKGVVVARKPKFYCWEVVDANWRATLPYQSLGHRNLEDRYFPPLPPYMYSGSIEVRGSELLDHIEAKLGEIVGNPKGVGRCVLRSTKTVGANTLDQLADFMGYNVEEKAAFLETVERYNECCRAGKDKDFGKDPAKMFEIKTPPFFASKIRANVSGLSGVWTDGNSHVIDSDGYPIEGLWAVGDVKGGRFSYGNKSTISCDDHPFAMTMGRLAGEMVVKS